ncbi:MAG: phosphoenolpyruvate synthase [Salinarimonadaceae bacterium]|nr:MAG: phosphoenolpyruvate synthase [Salinarimonadaceae bacterium]
MSARNREVIWFEELGRADVALVGGKNASLGEMVRHLGERGVAVPPGFATASQAFWRFIDANRIRDVIAATLDDLGANRIALPEAGKTIRSAILRGEWPDETAAAISAAYRDLCQRAGKPDAAVAVRSSATAEDLPDASFAGQQETFLNIRGEAALLDACRRCFASLFTDRAISYRQAKGFDHLKVALSVGVQIMVRSDVGGSGVMFTIDTETGFDKIVVIDAAWGLGETVVQGTVDPDEYLVFKPLLSDRSLAPIVEKRLGGKEQKMIYAREGDRPTRVTPTSKAERAAYVLSDEDILTLARWGCVIEEHYGCPMDIEWAKDGENGALFVVQARPETVQSRREAGEFRSYKIKSKGRRLVTGLSIGEAIVTGPVCLIESARDIDRFVDGAVLVTQNTDPDWVPIMKRAAAIVTDRGGRTSHAAIVSRELGLPAIVGTGDATQILSDGQEITVSCAEGDQGFVYEGFAEYEVETLDFANLPTTRTRIMLNLGNPAAAFRWWRIAADGVGLARMEFVVSNHIKVHPMALAHFDRLEDQAAKEAIAELTRGYADKTEYFVDRLARGLSRIAAAQHPKPVIIRMSDFKTNEYANLIGGAAFEPKEENPMIGFRGASRYYSPRYRDGFALECRAIRRLREEMGFRNVVVMIPFCRSIKEADRVLEVMAENGLRRGENGLEIYVMCEIPSNVILAGAFAERFDGFSIGSNDLTQLTLGVDRDSEELAELFDEQDEAVKWMIGNVIREAHAAGAKIGLCGQAPSDHPDFAEFLVACGIDSISVSPDSFIAVKRKVAEAEAGGAP